MACKMLLYEGSGSVILLISSSLKVIPNPVCPFWSFEPSVNISMFSLQSFILISFLFSMLI